MKRFIVPTFLALLVTVTANQYCVEEETAFLKEQEINVPAPSSAPSMSLECTTQTSNARGHYTSTVSPCTFEFHKAEENQQELDWIKFHTSNLCSSENSFLTVHEYVDYFPDECVADFQRCYSLEHHRSVIWDFLCTKGWDIPEGTTHVSVDCRRDKELIMQATTHRREEMVRGEHHARVETYQTKLFNLAGILGVCLVGVYAISNLIVKPLVATRLYAAACSGVPPCTCSGGTCTCQDILPRTIQPRYQLMHSGSSSLGGNSSSLSESAVFYGGDRPSDIMIMGAEEDEEGSSEMNESQLMDDFNSQVPDFDAVPITFAHGTTHRTTSDITTDSAILPMTHPLSTTTEESSSSGSSIPEVSIQTAAASIISSATTSLGRYSSNGPAMELELVSMVAEEPDDIPIVSATILYS